jgi:hypothetical protein
LPCYALTGPGIKNKNSVSNVKVMHRNFSIHKTLGAFLLFLLIATLPGYGLSCHSRQPDNDVVKINPHCKVKRFSNGDVLVTLSDANGKVESHRFSDFYADVVMAAYRKQRMEYIIQTLGKKYGLSEDECRRDIKHALNTLLEWGIVIRAGQIALN